MAKLLSINNYYYRRGGAEVVFLEQNRLFEKCGWEVVPFAMSHPSNFRSPWSKYFVDEVEFGQKYSIWEKLLRVPRVVYSFEARRKLKLLLETFHPDVSHIHNIYHHISPSILSLLRERGVYTVLTLHDFKLACPAYSMFTHDGVCERCKNNKLYNILLHRCIKRSLVLSGVVFLESSLHCSLDSYAKNIDRFVVPSRFIMEKMVEWGWMRNRFIHIPNFVDVKIHRPDYSVGKSFLYFGRLETAKGLETLVRAAALAKVNLQIAGVGSQESALRELAAKTGAEITFLGYLQGEALHNAVRSARVTVLPSECYENAPVSVMESYALGKPVLGAAIGGIKELIREGETGITFQSGSAESLAATMRHFSAMPDSRLADMGRFARRWVESDFTSDKYRERMLALYSELGVCV